MKQRKRHGLRRRREQEQKTNYHKRLRMLSSNLPRVVVRKSQKNIYAQIIEYAPTGDRVLLASSTKEIEKKYGWKTARNNTPAAYITGYLLGKKAQKAKIKKAVYDIGMQSIIKGSVLFSCLKGAVDAGMEIPHSKDVFPSEDRIQGKHLKTPLALQDIKQKIETTTK
jgi:large subunit ribosomal protein L18